MTPAPGHQERDRKHWLDRERGKSTREIADGQGVRPSIISSRVYRHRQRILEDDRDLAILADLDCPGPKDIEALARHYAVSRDHILALRRTLQNV